MRPLVQLSNISCPLRLFDISCPLRCPTLSDTRNYPAAESSATLPYLGTAAAARDMVALADYLDPDIQEINYWGFSYGVC